MIVDGRRNRIENTYAQSAVGEFRSLIFYTLKRFYSILLVTLCIIERFAAWSSSYIYVVLYLIIITLNMYNIWAFGIISNRSSGVSVRIHETTIYWNLISTRHIKTLYIHALAPTVRFEYVEKNLHMSSNHSSNNGLYGITNVSCVVNIHKAGTFIHKL